MIARAQRLAGRFPGVEIGPYWGTRALKVGGKSFANPCREPGALAVYCPVEMKPVLIQAAPQFYYDTPHFATWPAILVRLGAIDDETLAARLESAWLQRAPRKLAKAWEAVGDGV